MDIISDNENVIAILTKTIILNKYDQVAEKGGGAIIDFDDFELLRNGISPQQIKILDQPPKSLH